MNQSINNQPKFFDLHVSGIGYLNRAREVSVKRGKPFLAVDISAIHGPASEVQYTRFDCRVSGTEAQTLLQEFMPAIQAGEKVLVGFKLGDLYAETFTYQSGEKQGQTGVSLKARLLRITCLGCPNGERAALQDARRPVSKVGGRLVLIAAVGLAGGFFRASGHWILQAD